MIHSFLKHGAGPAARPSIGDTKMPKNGTRSSSRRPPPCARLTLWLLPAVPPTTPERPSTDSSPLSGGTCGANTGLGEGEAKPGGSSGPSRRMRCRGKGAGRTRRVRGGRPGPRGETARPLPQARARWAARRRCTRAAGPAPLPPAGPLPPQLPVPRLFPARGPTWASRELGPTTRSCEGAGASAAAGSAFPAPPWRGRAGRGGGTRGGRARGGEGRGRGRRRGGAEGALGVLHCPLSAGQGSALPPRGPPARAPGAPGLCTRAQSQPSLLPPPLAHSPPSAC